MTDLGKRLDALERHMGSSLEAAVRDLSDEELLVEVRQILARVHAEGGPHPEDAELFWRVEGLLARLPRAGVADSSSALSLII